MFYLYELLGEASNLGATESEGASCFVECVHCCPTAAKHPVVACNRPAGPLEDTLLVSCFALHCFDLIVLIITNVNTDTHSAPSPTSSRSWFKIKK